MTYDKTQKADYYADNREARREYGRKRYHAQKKACQHASKQYRLKHAARLKDYNHNYYLNRTKPERAYIRKGKGKNE